MSVQILKRFKEVPAGKFAGEEVATDFGLPKQWVGVGPKSIDEQLKILPDLLKVKPDSATKNFCQETLPGWFEMKWPDWIDGFFLCLNPLQDYHANLSGKVIPALAKKFSERGWIFANWREGQLGDDRLLLNKRTTAAYKKMAAIQKGNFWFIPMSLNGGRHPGKTCSPRRYLELAGRREFGIGPSEGLCAVLAHFNERIQPGKVFRMDFPGAKYDYPGGSERWTRVSYLGWDDDGGASFSASRAGYCYPGFASVLGLPTQR